MIDPLKPRIYKRNGGWVWLALSPERWSCQFTRLKFDTWEALYAEFEDARFFQRLKKQP